MVSAREAMRSSWRCCERALPSRPTCSLATAQVSPAAEPVTTGAGQHKRQPSTQAVMLDCCLTRPSTPRIGANQGS